MSSRKVRSYEGGRSIKSCIPLVEHGRVRLEHVRNPGNDVEGHGYVRGGCPCGQTDRVTEEDLVGAHLDQHRRQPSEITLYGADVRVRSVGVRYIVGHALSEAVWRKEGVERLKRLGLDPVYVEPSDTVGIPWGAAAGPPQPVANAGLYVFLRWHIRAASYGCTVIFTIKRGGHVLGEGARCPPAS